MTWRWRLALGAAVAIGFSAPANAGDQVDAWSCPAWIAAAEREYGIPPLLLQAIGRVVAGDAIDGGRAGTWILNVGGRMAEPPYSYRPRHCSHLAVEARPLLLKTGEADQVANPKLRLENHLDAEALHLGFQDDDTVVVSHDSYPWE